MKLLCIDSSTPIGSVALLENETILAQFSLSKKKSISDSLLTLVDRALEQCKIDLRDVDGLGVTMGPGSFTGLRVGMSLVKGIVIATRKPFVKVSSLEALAARLEPTELQICSLIDARKKEVYAAFFKYDCMRLQRLTKDEVLNPKELADRIKQKTVFIGPGLDAYKKYLQDCLGDLFVNGSHIKIESTAASLGSIAFRDWNNLASQDLNRLKIHYIRKSEAENQLKVNYREGGNYGN